MARVGDPGVTADVEGLTIYYASAGKGCLIACSQGNNTFPVYAREGDHRFVLTIDPKGRKKKRTVDDVSRTDGNQNFKLYTWEDIAGTRLIVDTRWSPRSP